MPFLYNDDGHLTVDGVLVSDIVAAHGTPLYIYSAAGFVDYFTSFQQAVAPVKGKVHFAVKANSAIAVLRLLAKQGAGADIVSGGEMMRALAAGIAPADIVFSGVGKTDDEIRLALSKNIGQINAESLAEIYRIEAIAAEWDMKAPVAIRVNPDVDPGSHEKISTGQKTTKFGIPIANGEAAEIYRYLQDSAHLTPRGLAMHIGSQLRDLAPFRKAYLVLLELADSLRAAGCEVSHLDLGGGLGIDYEGQERPDFAAYGALVEELFASRDYQLGFEPGRSIAADNGILVTSVLYTKPAEDKAFVITDAAMNDLIRPTLYDAHHRIEAVELSNRAQQNSDIVGPVCETGDYLAKGQDMPEMQAGELLAVFNAGAYGAVMSSSYNTRPVTAECLVMDDGAHIIRPRKSIEEMLAEEQVPDSLTD